MVFLHKARTLYAFEGSQNGLQSHKLSKCLSVALSSVKFATPPYELVAGTKDTKILCHVLSGADVGIDSTNRYNKEFCTHSSDFPDRAQRGTGRYTELQLDTSRNKIPPANIECSTPGLNNVRDRPHGLEIKRMLEVSTNRRSALVRAFLHQSTWTGHPPSSYCKLHTRPLGHWHWSCLIDKPWQLPRGNHCCVTNDPTPPTG